MRCEICQAPPAPGDWLCGPCRATRCTKCEAPPAPGDWMCKECRRDYEWQVGYAQGRLGGSQTAGSMAGYDAGRADGRRS